MISRSITGLCELDNLMQSIIDNGLSADQKRRLELIRAQRDNKVLCFRITGVRDYVNAIRSATNYVNGELLTESALKELRLCLSSDDLDNHIAELVAVDSESGVIDYEDYLGFYRL
jgi:hypothetical protein